jgi:hypothetical protein
MHAADAVTILIPLNYNGPGAFGSHWHTLVLVNNRTNRDLTTRTLLDICPPGVDCASPYLIAGTTGRLVNDAPHGIIFSSPSAPISIGRLYASVHIAAEPNDPTTSGTEIPIATDADFDSTFVVLNVPTGALNSHPTRSLLRIYSLSFYGRGQAFLTVYAHDNPAVPLGVMGVALVKSSYDDTPMYAEVDMSQFAALSPSVDVVIDAGTATRIPQNGDPNPGATFPFKVWGFVTVTDNATNQVATITAR